MALVDGTTARVVKRIPCTPSSVARHHWAGDLNGDGAATSDDFPPAPILRAALRSGFISNPDPASGPDNPIGCAGYVFNPEALLSTVRFRTYDPEMGRWVERDPLGYVHGPVPYSYIGGAPTSELDPAGLGPLDWIMRGYYGCPQGVNSDDVFLGKDAQGNRRFRTHIYDENGYVDSVDWVEGDAVDEELRDKAIRDAKFNTACNEYIAPALECGIGVIGVAIPGPEDVAIVATRYIVCGGKLFRLGKCGAELVDDAAEIDFVNQMRRSSGAPEIHYTDKVLKKNKLAKRGWTDEKVADVILNPYKGRTCSGIDHKDNTPVIHYIGSDGHYVSVRTTDGKVIHVSNCNDPNWEMQYWSSPDYDPSWTFP